VTSIGSIVLNDSTQAPLVAAQSVLRSASAEPVDDEALGRQIVQAIRLQWQGGVGEARVQLKPEHLGTLTVSLKVEGGAVSADIHAETQAAQQWISAHETDLRSGLERQGMTLERFNVHPDAEQQQRQQGRGSRSSATPQPRLRRR